MLVCMYGWMDGRMDASGWMDGCIRMDGWMHACMHVWSRVPCSRERELGGPYHWGGGQERELGGPYHGGGARDPGSGLIYIQPEMIISSKFSEAYPPLSGNLLFLLGFVPGVDDNQSSVAYILKNSIIIIIISIAMENGPLTSTTYL